MLDFNTGFSTDCSGATRRDFLRVGSLAALGLTLPAASARRAATTASKRTPPSCILMWMQGGPSHIDTFDPKPDAPAEVRGEFGTIPTTHPRRPLRRAPAAAGPAVRQVQRHPRPRPARTAATASPTTS